MGARLMLDVDGCIADFTSKFESILQACYGFSCDFSRYDLGLPNSIFRECYDLMIRAELFSDLPEYQFAAETVQRWARKNTIWYVTRRRAGVAHELTLSLQSQTTKWLLSKGFPTPQNLIFTQDKQSWCRENGMEVAVEDFWPDAKRLNGLRTTAGYLRCYLVSRPWNQGDYPRRVNYLQEVEELG